MGFWLRKNLFVSLAACSFDRASSGYDCECRNCAFPILDFSLRHSKWFHLIFRFGLQDDLVGAQLSHTEKCVQREAEGKKKHIGAFIPFGVFIALIILFSTVSLSVRPQMKWQEKSWNHFDCILNMGIYFVSFVVVDFCFALWLQIAHKHCSRCYQNGKKESTIV